MELQSRHPDTRSHAAAIDHEELEHGQAQTQRQSAAQPQNVPGRSISKLVCAGFSFFFAGTNDGSLGPLLPYMLHRYNISTALVTVMCVS